MDNLKSATHVETVIDPTAAIGPFLAKGIDQQGEVSERTQLLPKSRSDEKEEVHYRNIDGKRHFFWLLCTIIFGNTIAFFDVFYLTATITQPLYGRISDVIGRRPVYLFAIAIFLLSTAWCALAQSIGSFIAARAACGLGAGGVIAMSSIIMSDIVKLEYRGIYQSYLNMAWGGGSGLGAAFGGLLCESLGWRAAFSIQLPFILVSAILATILIPHALGLNLAQSQGKSVFEALKSFDFNGAITLTIALSCLILGINLGGNIFAWTHPLVISSVILFVVASIFVIFVERRAANPVLPLNFLNTIPNANLMWSNLLTTLVSSNILFNVALFQQVVRQETATKAGLYLISPLAGVSLASLLAGYYITYTRRMKPMLLLGAICLLAGIVAITVLCSYTNVPSWAFVLLISGGHIGQGFFLPASTLAALTLNADDQQAVVTTTLGLLRNLGVILGVSISSWALQNTLNVYLEKYVTGSDAVKNDIIQGVRSSIETIKTLEPKAKAEVLKAYAAALQWTFALGIVFAVAVLLLVLPVRLSRLQSRMEVVSDSDSEAEIEDSNEAEEEEEEEEEEHDEEDDEFLSDTDGGYGTSEWARRQSTASSRSGIRDRRQSTASARSFRRDRRPSFDAWSIS